MDQVSFEIIGKALDGLSMRQKYLAQNIANSGTENYVPIRVSFEEHLRTAYEQGIGAINSVEPTIQKQSFDDLNGGMRLDLEIARMGQTASRYSALINVLGKHMNMHRSIVSDGGR